MARTVTRNNLTPTSRLGVDVCENGATELLELVSQVKTAGQLTKSARFAYSKAPPSKIFQKQNPEAETSTVGKVNPHILLPLDGVCAARAITRSSQVLTS